MACATGWEDSRLGVCGGVGARYSLVVGGGGGGEDADISMKPVK